MTTSHIHILDLKAAAKEEVVKEVRELLRLAEAGEIVDLAWCASNVDGSVHTNYTATDNALLRLAAVARLEHRLQVSMDDGIQQ